MKTLLELCCEKVHNQRELWPLDVRGRNIPMNHVQGMISYYEDISVHKQFGRWVSGLNYVIENHPWVREQNRLRLMWCWGQFLDHDIDI